MAQKSSEKDRNEKTVLQFQRIDQFLKDNSKRFYEEYDTTNETLQALRSELLKKMGSQSQKQLGKQVQLALDIDHIDGISSRLNTLTLVLTKIANPSMFQNFIMKQLNIQDLEHLSMRQIPWEVDAILFITNPLLIFDLLADFLDYQKKQKGFIRLYITSRVGRLLFRFTRFVLVYDEFREFVNLTFLDPKRLGACASQFVKVVHILCQETRDSLVKQESPIYLNDLRRLYIILAHALFRLSFSKKHTYSAIKDALIELTSVFSMEEQSLHDDHIYDEFVRFHFTSNEVLYDEFLGKFAQIQGYNIEFALELVGHLHPMDRLVILKDTYQQSKSYILTLFAYIRQIYQYHGDNLLPFYKATAITIQEIVNFSEIQNDSFVDDSLKELLFIHEKLSLEEYSPLMELDNNDLEFAKIKEIPLDESLGQSEIFEAIRKDEEEAEKKNYIFGLAGIPFCYLTIEFGKPCYNLFTLGEIPLLNLSDSDRVTLITYLVNTRQITESELQTMNKVMPKVTRLMEKIVEKWNVARGSVQLSGSQKDLKFYEFKQAVSYLQETFDTYLPEFLRLYKYKQFSMEVLSEIERWLARNDGIPLEQLSLKKIPYFIESEEIDSFWGELKTSLTGYQFKDQLESSLSDPELFKRFLIMLHLNKQKILAYEQQRLTISNDSPAKPKKKLIPQEQKDDSVKSFILHHLTRNKVFEDLKSNPEKIEPYLLELGRIPFRFIESVYDKQTMVLFTLADTIVLDMKGREHKALLEFLRVTKQIEKEEWVLLKENFVKLIVFLKRMCANLKKEKSISYLKDNHINFTEFSRGITAANSKLSKEIPHLFEFKNKAQFFLEGLSECERWIAREKDVSINNLDPQHFVDILNDSQFANNALSHLKETSIGRKYFQDLSITPKSTEIFCQYLIKEYQQNVRLFKYDKKYQK